MKRFILIAAILIAPLFTTSCSTISERPALAQLAVQYAVVKVLENNPDRAGRVVEIATFIEENSGSSSATSVAVLEALVRKQINWDKIRAESPADAILIDSLIAMVRQELTARLGDGPLGPEQALVVKEVAGWIKTAALLSQSS